MKRGSASTEGLHGFICRNIALVTEKPIKFIRRKNRTHQILDAGLQLLLGHGNGFLRSHDDNDLTVGVVLAGEDDPGSSLVPHTLDIGTLASNEEFVMLGLGADLGDAAGQLLLVGHLGQHLLGLLNVFLRSSNCDLHKRQFYYPVLAILRNKVSKNVSFFYKERKCSFLFTVLQLGRYNSS